MKINVEVFYKITMPSCTYEIEHGDTHGPNGYTVEGDRGAGEFNFIPELNDTNTVLDDIFFILTERLDVVNESALKVLNVSARELWNSIYDCFVGPVMIRNANDYSRAEESYFIFKEVYQNITAIPVELFDDFCKTAESFIGTKVSNNFDTDLDDRFDDHYASGFNDPTDTICYYVLEATVIDVKIVKAEE